MEVVIEIRTFLLMVGVYIRRRGEEWRGVKAPDAQLQGKKDADYNVLKFTLWSVISFVSKLSQKTASVNLAAAKEVTIFLMNYFAEKSIWGAEN